MNSRTTQGRALMENIIHVFFKDLFFLNLKNLKYIPFLIKNLKHQKAAAKRRKNHHEVIPPILALSITNKCNLNCIGCYQKSQKNKRGPEFTDKEIINLLHEARNLGMISVMLLGGEPLMKDIFWLTKDFKDMIFAVFTNSTLIDDAIVEKFRTNKHLMPVLSMEGIETEKRRGKGIMDCISEVSSKLHKKRIFYGISLTVTRINFDEVCNEKFIRKMIKNGVMFFSFFKYIPINEDTLDYTLSTEQEKLLDEFTLSFKQKYKTLILSPNLEHKYGGCVGAGKGVIHINYDGAVEPCPFVPYSDISVKNGSIAEALQSELFKNLRRHHKSMTNCGLQMCTLWKEPKWVYAIKQNDFSLIEN